MGRLTQTAPSQAPAAPAQPAGGFLSTIGSVVRNLPTAVLRGLGVSLGEAKSRTAATIAPYQDKVDRAIGNALGLQKSTELRIKSREYMRTAEQRALGGLTLPGQTVPLINTLEPYRTPQEALGSWGEAALDTALLALTGGAGSTLKPLAKEAAKAGAKETLKGLATKEGLKAAAKVLLFDATIGAGYGAAVTAQDPEARPQDILRSAAIGAGIGVAAPPLLGGATRFATRALSLAGREIAAGADKVAGRLEGIAGRSEREAAALKASEKFLFSQPEVRPRTIGETAADVVARGIRSAEGLPLSLKTLLENRFAPIKELDERISKLTGKNGPVDLENEFQLTKVITTDAQRDIINFIDESIAPFGKEVTALAKQQARFLDALDRIRLGQQVEGGVSEKQILESFDAFRKSLSTDVRRQIDAAVSARQRVLRSVLDDTRDAGRITDETYNRLVEAHPNYIPHRVLDFLNLEDPLAVKDFPSAMTAGSLAMKRAKGSTRAIDDVDTAIVDYLVRAKVANQKQRAVQALFDRITGAEETFGFRRLEEAPKRVDIPKGKDVVTIIRNGQKQVWELPKEIGFVLRNLDISGSSVFSRWLSNTSLGKLATLSRRLTAAATVSYNPLFVYLRNPIRDIQTAQFFVGNIMKDLAAGIRETFAARILDGAPSKDFLAAEKSGAFIGSILKEEQDPQKIIFRLMQDKGIIGKTIPQGAKNFASKTTLGIGETMEQAVRLSVFKRMLRAGNDPKAAAKMARNATVDFSKAGTLIEALNKVIPFLNPAVQGTINYGRMFVDKPTEFYRRSMAYAALPAALLYAWNSKFDAYQEVPEGEKQRNWIIMVGEEDGHGLNGERIKVPFLIKIPKSEVQMLVSGAIEHVLNVGRETHPQEMEKFLGELAGNLNPVGNNTLLLPEGFKQAVELKANYSFFRKGQIEPDWVLTPAGWKRTLEVPPEERTQKQTSEIAKIVGEAMGWSPIKIDYVIKTGVIGDLVRLLDIPLRTPTGEEKPDYKEALSKEGLSNAPFIRGVFTSYSLGDVASRKEEETATAQEKTKAQIEKVRARETGAQATKPTGGGRLGRQQ